MPNRDTHLLIGFLVGVGAYAVTRWIQNEEIKPLSALIAGAGGALAGELPDLLEPATSPNHRSHLHSVGTGGVIIYGMVELNKVEEVDKDLQAIFNGVICGYISHLAADSTTKKSLPLI